MILKVLFIVSILFQLVAAVVAIKLIRATKYNASWILISVALALMALTRIGEFVRHIMGKNWPLSQEVMVWIGILISVCFTIGIFMIPKILNYIFQMEHQKRISAERIINIVIHICNLIRAADNLPLQGLRPFIAGVAQNTVSNLKA